MRCTRCDCKRTSTLRLRVHPAIILDSRVISESSFIKLAEKRKKNPKRIQVALSSPLCRPLLPAGVRGVQRHPGSGRHRSGAR